MIIRAVTLFYPVESGRVNADELSQELVKLRNVIDGVGRRRGGIEIRTWRVTLPFTDLSWDLRNYQQ